MGASRVLRVMSPTPCWVPFPVMQNLARFEAHEGWRWRFENDVAIHEIDPDHTALRFWAEPKKCPI